MRQKIGILTFHDALNYGAVLQAFALQEFISTNGHDVEIIDYKPKYRKSFEEQKFTSRNPIKQLIGDLITASHYFSISRRHQRFIEFVRDYHNLSQVQYSNFEELDNNCQDYDILISGSDQVFNPKRDSDLYYLAFDKFHGKRIGYAPSLGLSELPAEIEQKIKPWISAFDHLSCRESEGAKVLEKIYERPVPIVCDPVCLIDKSRWEEVTIMPNCENYIFVFDLNGGKRLFDLAESLHRQTGLPIIYSTLKSIHFYAKGCASRYDLGPREWLGHIAKASYVVTDSFHGTMLSLVLGVPVLNIIAAKATSSRLTSIMTRLCIDDQLVSDIHNFDLQKIKFNNYHDKLSQFVSESKQYLLGALEK